MNTNISLVLMFWLMGGSIKSIAFVQLFSHVAVHTLYLYISWEKHKKNRKMKWEIL